MGDNLAIDVIVQAFSEPLGPELCRRISEATPHQLEAFADIYSTWSASAGVLAREEGDVLRPYVPQSGLWWLTNPDYARYGMEASGPADVFRASPLLKTILLYSPSVALPNPLSRHVSFYPCNPSERRHDEFRQDILAFARFSSQVDELVREGILVWLEPLPYVQLKERDHHEPNLALPPESAVDPRSEHGYITRIAVTQSVEACLQYGLDEVDVFCPNRLGAAILGHAVKQDSRIASPSGAEPEAGRVAGLLETPVPDVGALPFEEIAALRRNAQGFATYRNQLRTAIDEATALARRGASAEAQARVARELFTPGRLAIERELTRTWRDRAWESVTRAGVGALVGEVANATLGADSQASPARIATNAVGDLLLQARETRRTRRNLRTLAAHYAVFASTS